MAHLRGGMEFRRGRPVKAPAAPPRLATGVLRLVVAGDVAVTAGQAVGPGHVLARTGEAASAIAPVAGRVDAVTPMPAEVGPTRHAIAITPAEPESPTTLPWTPPGRPILADWCAALRELGLWPQDGLAVALRTQLESARHRPPRMLLGIALDRFPPFPDRSSVLSSFRDDVLLGLSLMGRITGAREVILAVDRAVGVAGLRGACRGFDIRLRHVENAYPWASPTMLLHELTGGQIRLPHEADPMPHGVMLVTPWTAARLARSVMGQALDLARPVFLAYTHGSRPLQPTWAMPGQALGGIDAALAGHADELADRVVLGDPMTGHPAEGVPSTASGTPGPAAAVLSEADQLLSMLPGVTAPRASPCIHCGWCTDVCPTRLRPIHLVQAFRHSRGEPTFRQHIDWCIDCGLCSHVCPAHIPIAQTLRAARQQLREAAP